MPVLFVNRLSDRLGVTLVSFEYCLDMGLDGVLGWDRRASAWGLIASPCRRPRASSLASTVDMTPARVPDTAHVGRSILWGLIGI